MAHLLAGGAKTATVTPGGRGPFADGGQVPLTFADDRTSTKKWAELGIQAQSFKGITVDQFEVVELGAEVKLTYDCVRNP